MNYRYYIFVLGTLLLATACGQSVSAPTQVQQEGLDPTTIQAQVLSGSTLSQ